MIGLRYYRDPGSYDYHHGLVMHQNLPYIERHVLFPYRSAADYPVGGEWQSAYFGRMLRVGIGDVRLVAVHFPRGLHYLEEYGLDGTTRQVEDLEVLEDGDGGANGLYGFGNQLYLPYSYHSSLYGIDVIFLADSEVAG